MQVDNLLKPRRRYMEEDHLKIILENQREIFLLARRWIRWRQMKRKEGINKGQKEVELSVGDPVFYKFHTKEGKLNHRWELYYRIV